MKNLLKEKKELNQRTLKDQKNFKKLEIEVFKRYYLNFNYRGVEQSGSSSGS